MGSLVGDGKKSLERRYGKMAPFIKKTKILAKKMERQNCKESKEKGEGEKRTTPS